MNYGDSFGANMQIQKIFKYGDLIRFGCFAVAYDSVSDFRNGKYSGKIEAGSFVLFLEDVDIPTIGSSSGLHLVLYKNTLKYINGIVSSDVIIHEYIDCIDLP